MPKGLSRKGRDAWLRNADFFVAGVRNRLLLPLQGFTDELDLSTGVVALPDGWQLQDGGIGANTANVWITATSGIAVKSSAAADPNAGRIALAPTVTAGATANVSVIGKTGYLTIAKKPAFAAKVVAPATLTGATVSMGFVNPASTAAIRALVDPAEASANTMVFFQLNADGTIVCITRIGTSTLESETLLRTFSASESLALAIRFNDRYEPEFWIGDERVHVGPACTSTTNVLPTINSKMATDTATVTYHLASSPVVEWSN